MASLTRAGRQLDVASMYGPRLTFIALSIGCWFPRRPSGGRTPSGPSRPWPVRLATATLVRLDRFKRAMSARTVLSTPSVTVSVLGGLDAFRAAREMSRRWLVRAGAALAAGGVGRELEVAGRCTGPDSWIQGHAPRHVFSALALGFPHGYHRSEQILQPSGERDAIPASSPVPESLTRTLSSVPNLLAAGRPGL